MRKLGMRREGRMRQERQAKGAWRDTYLYAVLAHEYLTRV
jgi:RimJ/RimL family protein N-acetyltransferase